MQKTGYEDIELESAQDDYHDEHGEFCEEINMEAGVES